MQPVRRVAVRGIIVKDGKIFAVRHKEKDGSPAKFWATPGGGLEPGESLLDGINREMIEETGIAPNIGRLLMVQQYVEEAREHIEFFFHIENADHYLDIDLDSTTHGNVEIYDYGFIGQDKKILPEVLQTLNLVEYTEHIKPPVVIYYSE